MAKIYNIPPGSKVSIETIESNSKIYFNHTITRQINFSEKECISYQDGYYTFRPLNVNSNYRINKEDVRVI